MPRLRRPPYVGQRAVLFFPSRCTSRGASHAARRQSQGRDSWTASSAASTSGWSRGCAGWSSGSCGYSPRRGAGRPGRARPARPLRRRAGPAPLRRRTRPAGRGQAAGLQPAARAARLAVDPYRGRDRQRRHAVPGRQRQHRARTATGWTSTWSSIRCWRCAATRPGGCVDLGPPSEAGDGLARELHACRGRPAERPRGARRGSRPICAACWAMCATRSRTGGRCATGSARPLAELRVGAAPCRPSSAAEAEAFLRLARRRPLHLARLLQLRARAHARRACSCGGSRAPALGILRAKDDGGLSQSFAACRPRCAHARREPLPLLTITKANTRSTVHRATYLDFIGVKRFAPDGQRDRRAPLPRPADLGRLQHEPAPDPAARPQGRARRRPRPASAHAAMPARRCSTSSRPTRATSCSRPPRTSCSRSPPASCTCRIGRGCACSSARDPFGRFVSCLVFVPRDRYNTALRERMQQLLEQAVRRHARASSRPSCRNRRWPGCCSRCARPSGVPDRARHRRARAAAAGGRRAAGPIACATR